MDFPVRKLLVYQRVNIWIPMNMLIWKLPVVHHHILPMEIEIFFGPETSPLNFFESRETRPLLDLVIIIPAGSEDGPHRELMPEIWIQ